MQQKYPYVRQAMDADYEAIWTIWMQDHVLRWMSFSKQDAKSFKVIYDQLAEKSDIYVMIDEFDGKEKVVGVRRIQYLKGKYSHIAEFCSMGVDEAVQGKKRGYGEKFYQEFEKIIEQNKNIKVIKLTQDGGNYAAFHIADKLNYQEEAVFPDWLKREGQNKASYFIIERFVSKIVDNKLLTQLETASLLSYEAQLPLLKGSTTNLSVELEENKITVFDADNNPILETEYNPDDSVISHIGFLDNIVLHSNDDKQCEAAMRQMLSFIVNTGRVKKLELFVIEPRIATLCQTLGFLVRGHRIAGCYQNGEYHNELGVEYSFFGIQEATDILLSFDILQNNDNLRNVLEKCNQCIQVLVTNGECDTLGSLYLQNIVYQLVRDTLPFEKLMSLQQQPWQKVIAKSPEKFQIALMALNKELQQVVKIQSQQTAAPFFKSVPSNALQVDSKPSVNKQGSNCL